MTKLLMVLTLAVSLHAPNVHAAKLCEASLGIGVAPTKRSRIEVTNAELDGSKLAKSILQLAQRGALLNQMDPRLNQYGLHVPHGGLCVSTCVVNLLGAFAEANLSGHTFEQNSTQFLAAIVRLYPYMIKDHPILGKLELPPATPNEPAINALVRPLAQALFDILKDARYGAPEPSIFLKTLNEFLVINGARLKADQPAGMDTLRQWADSDSIMILSAAIRDRLSGEGPTVHRRHALVVLKYFANTNEIVISDPNDPNLIYREVVRTDSAGRLYFPTRVKYTANGANAYLETLDIVYRPKAEIP